MLRALKEAGKNIIRNKGASLSSVLVLTLTFFITSIFLLAMFVSHRALAYLETKAQLVAFFKDKATEEQILALKDTLEATGKVEEVKYTSKEEALKIYQARFKEEPLLLESITANIFPASLELRAKKVEYLSFIYDSLKESQLIEDIVYYKDVLGRFKIISQMVEYGGIALAGALSLVSVAVVLFAVGTIISQRREEIEIMRLLGARKTYIRLPLLLQGMIYGVLGVLLSSLLIGALVPQVSPYVSWLLAEIPLPKITSLLGARILGGEVIFGAFLGGLGSTLAIRKYLRY